MAILRVVMTIINIIMILIFLTKTDIKDRDTATGALASEIVFICNIILIWN